MCERMSDCDHQTVTYTTDDGEEREVCPVCDDVQVETLDEGSS